MILWVHRQTGEDRFYLALGVIPSKEQFMAAARVRPRSYAGRMLERIYSQIFEGSLELKHDYETYYQVEYAEFTKYAKRRRRLKSEEAEKISAVYQSSAVILEYRPRQSFLQEEVGTEMLTKLLTLGGVE